MSSTIEGAKLGFAWVAVKEGITEFVSSRVFRCRIYNWDCKLDAFTDTRVVTRNIEEIGG